MCFLSYLLSKSGGFSLSLVSITHVTAAEKVIFSPVWLLVG